MHFFEVAPLGSIALFPPFLPLFKHERQTIFLELLAARLHSFDYLLIGIAFSSPARKLDFGKQPEVTCWAKSGIIYLFCYRY